MTPAEARAFLEAAWTDNDRPYALHLQLLPVTHTTAKEASHAN